MDISALTHQMVILFSILFLAYGATKLGLLPKNANKPISSLILNLTCPATILYSMVTSSRSLGNGDVLYILGLSIGIHGLFMVLAQLMVTAVKAPSSNRGVYRAMIVQANVSFLGFPLIRSLFGTEGLFIASIYNIIFNLVSYTYGTSQLASRPEDRRISLRMLCTPVLLCSYLGLVLYFTGVSLPSTVVEILGALDQITSPASMVVIGCALAGIPIRQVFSNWRVYVGVFVRLIAAPVAVWVILKPFVQSELILQVLVAVSALPSATNITLLSSQYDGDVKTASSGLFLTTVLSIVTLPALLELLF